MHGHDAVLDDLEQFDGILSGDDRVRGIILDSESR